MFYYECFTVPVKYHSRAWRFRLSQRKDWGPLRLPALGAREAGRRRTRCSREVLRRRSGRKATMVSFQHRHPGAQGHRHTGTRGHKHSTTMNSSSQQQPPVSSSPASFIREFSFAQQGSSAAPSSESRFFKQPPGWHFPPAWQPTLALTLSLTLSSTLTFTLTVPLTGAFPRPSATPQQDISVLARDVHRRQQGGSRADPVLAHIRNVRWVFGDIVPDYLLGSNTCAPLPIPQVSRQASLPITKVRPKRA